MIILPRFIRHRDASGYLGVDRNKFDANIRPLLTEIPLGAHSMAFDRLELDAWADEYKRRHGRISLRPLERALWGLEQGADAASVQASPVLASGTESSIEPNTNKRKAYRENAGASKAKRMSHLERVRMEFGVRPKKPR
jgi:hypothetical protein